MAIKPDNIMQILGFNKKQNVGACVYIFDIKHTTTG